MMLHWFYQQDWKNYTDWPAGGCGCRNHCPRQPSSVANGFLQFTNNRRLQQPQSALRQLRDLDLVSCLVQSKKKIFIVLFPWRCQRSPSRSRSMNKFRDLIEQFAKNQGRQEFLNDGANRKRLLYFFFLSLWFFFFLFSSSSKAISLLTQLQIFVGLCKGHQPSS